MLLQEKWLRRQDNRRSSTLRASFQPQQRDEEQTPTLPAGRRRFGPAVLRSTSDVDRQQQVRSWPVRYLVAWLPWLSLLSHYDKELTLHAISREGRGLRMPLSWGKEPWLGDMTEFCTRLGTIILIGNSRVMMYRQ